MGGPGGVGAPPPSGGTANVGLPNVMLSPRSLAHMPLVPVAGSLAVPVSGVLLHPHRPRCAADTSHSARSLSPVANGKGDCLSPRYPADAACTAESGPSYKHAAAAEGVRKDNEQFKTAMQSKCFNGRMPSPEQGGSLPVMQGRLPPSPLRSRGLVESGSKQAALSSIPSSQRIPAVGSRATAATAFAPFPRAKSPMEVDRPASPNRTTPTATTADIPAMLCTQGAAAEVVAPNESRNASSPAHLETFCTDHGMLAACSVSTLPAAETLNGMDLGRHGFGSCVARNGVLSPRKDGRRQRGHLDLYEDAFARQQRLRNIKDTQEQALEREQQMRLEQHQQGMRQRRRMYHTKDARTHLEREEEYLRKKKDKEMMNLIHLHQRERDELKECTFKPILATKKSDRGGCRHQSPSQRHSGAPVPTDSSSRESNLQHLVQQQHAIIDRLLALVGEDARLKDKLRTMHSDLHDRIQSEETGRVVAMLQDAGSDASAQQELIHRVRSMGASGFSPEMAQRVIVDELVAHSHEEVQRRVLEAFAPMRFEAEKELYDRRLALVQELVTLEDQAAATFSDTAGLISGGQSGFQFGLAEQARQDLPLPPVLSPPLPSASRLMHPASSSDCARVPHTCLAESGGAGMSQVQTSTPPGPDARLRAPPAYDIATTFCNRHIDGDRAESSADEMSCATHEVSHALANQQPLSKSGLLEENKSPRLSAAQSMFKTPRTLSFSRSLAAGEFAAQMQSAVPITPPLPTTSGMPHGGAVHVKQLHDDCLNSDAKPELPPVCCCGRPDKPEFNAASRPAASCSCEVTSQAWTTPLRTSGHDTSAAGVSVTLTPAVTSEGSDS